MKKIFQKIGIAISLATFSLSNVGFANLALATGTGTKLSLANMNPTDLNLANEPQVLITNVVTLVFILAAALTFFFLVAGAIAWITSGGDKGKVEEARNKITAAVIGLLILAATWAIFILIMRIAFNSDDATIPTLNKNTATPTTAPVPNN